MELKEGMYVRTLDGIMKVMEFRDNGVMTRFVNEDGNVHFINDLIDNPSNNIIGLIEEGDYVNGFRVDYIENINANDVIVIQRILCEEYEKDLFAKSFTPKEIKSIVTKEQFEAIKYEL